MLLIPHTASAVLLGAATLPPPRRAGSPVAAAKVGRVLKSYAPADFPAEWPYSPQDLTRMDETADINFYDSPRFVTHIDDGAIAAITAYYSEALPPGADVLDLCSSWISHLPPQLPLGRVVGLGMNARELEANERLTEWVQRDLNTSPSLPFDDNSFSAILNVVSVDYLCKPKEVFAEMHRVLRPGGQAIMSFSNRCFPTKAVGMWLAQGDEGRRQIVGSYFALSPRGGWKDITAIDITGAGSGADGAAAPGAGEGLQNPLAFVAQLLQQATGAGGDPMYVVRATKA